MKQRLTDTLIKQFVAPTVGRVDITDTVHPGLRIRFSCTGSKTWIVQKKIKNGRRHAITLGSYPGITLKTAREEAYKLHVEAEAGLDRTQLAKKIKDRAEAEALTAKTVSDILQLYFTTHLDRNLKPGPAREERKAQLLTHLNPLLRSRIDSVTRAELQGAVDAKAAEGKVVMANRVRLAFTAFFGWAYQRAYTPQNPSAGIQKAGKETPRQRCPNLDEVKEIYAATHELEGLWGPLFRLFILTGQRSRSDVLKMQWSWLDWEKLRYSIPRPKNAKPHIVHLSSEALTELFVIKKMRSEMDSRDPASLAVKTSLFVFTTTGVTPSSGISKAKRRLDEIIARNRQKAGRELIEPWHTHDLRRSQATELAEAGIDEGVVDRIQNHVAGGSKPSAVAAVYNKALKLPERARAQDAWADMVMGRRAAVISIAGNDTRFAGSRVGLDGTFR